MAATVAVAAEDLIEFDPPRDASVRTASRGILPGMLLRCGPDFVELEVPGGGGRPAKVQRLPVAEIISLRTLDGSFRYTSEDDWSAALRSLGQLAGTRRMAGAADDAPRDSEEAPQPALTPDPSSLPQPAPRTSPLSERVVTVICENCGKEVSVTATYGQRCPHCGIQWEFEVRPPDGPASAPNPNAAFPLDAPPGAPPPPQPQLGLPAPGHQQPAPSTNSGGHLPPPAAFEAIPELSLATIPLWMKAGLFVGSILLGYYMLFYRR